MKKVNLILVISMVFMIMTTTACKQVEFHGWTPPIKGLHWGMTEEEVIKAMDLKTEDFTRTEEGAVALVGTKKEYNVFGTKTTISLSFYNDCLTTISAKVKEGDIDTVDKRLTKELGEGDYRYSENPDSSNQDVVSVYRSDAYVKDDLDLYDRIMKIYLEAEFDLLKAIIPLEYSLGELPLTTCEFSLDKTSAMYGLLTIDGKIAAVLNHPKMLSKNRLKD